MTGDDSLKANLGSIFALFFIIANVGSFFITFFCYSNVASLDTNLGAMLHYPSMAQVHRLHDIYRVI